jgi:hypothetical protein
MKVSDAASSRPVAATSKFANMAFPVGYASRAELARTRSRPARARR